VSAALRPRNWWRVEPPLCVGGNGVVRTPARRCTKRAIIRCGVEPRGSGITAAGRGAVSRCDRLMSRRTRQWGKCVHSAEWGARVGGGAGSAAVEAQAGNSRGLGGVAGGSVAPSQLPIPLVVGTMGWTVDGGIMLTRLTVPSGEWRKR